MSPCWIPSTMLRSLWRPVSMTARSSSSSSSRFRIVEWASLITTVSAPASRNPTTAALTSEVNMRRHRCHSSVPGSTSAGQVTPVAPSISAEIKIFIVVRLSSVARLVRRPKRRVEEEQRLSVGVQVGCDADREGLEIATVTDVRPGDHRHSEISKPLEQDLLNEFGRAAVNERPGHNPGDSVEIPGATQLSEHPVKPELLLVNVLDQQNAAFGGP